MNLSRRRLGLSFVVAVFATGCTKRESPVGGIALHVDDAEAAYPVQIDPLIGIEQAKLVADDGVMSDYFGSAVSLSGDTALVGARGDDDKGTDSGSAYVFVRSGKTWTPQAKLLASDGFGTDYFGSSVALSGDTALVGAPSSYVGTNDSQGSVYVFTRTGAMWTEQAKLIADDGTADDFFGASLSLSGDTALVGAIYDDDNGTDSGSAYVFVRSGTTWTQQAKLLASDGTADDFFGASSSLSGDTALVGAPGKYATDFGSAYEFVRSGTTWTQQAKLLPSDGAPGNSFGSSLSLSGDTALVGAGTADDNGTDSGSAYVFVRSGTTWTQQAKLLASDGTAYDSFANSLSLFGDTALLSSAGVAKGSKGLAYIFVRSGMTWTQQTTLVATDGVAGDLFGHNVSLFGNNALVGASFDDDKGMNSGSAYLFALGSANGDPCIDVAECASGFCVDGVCCNATCGNGDPSDCEACSVATGAAVDGTCAPASMGTLCRASTGACDVAESCDGAANDCPADTKVAAGTECRASVGECDAAETCDGAVAECPADVNSPDGTACTDGACTDGICKGFGGAGGSGGVGGGNETGGAGGSGANETGGAGGSGGDGVTDPSSCDCRVAGASSGKTPYGAPSLLGIAVLVTRRRWRAAIKTRKR